MPAYLFDSSAIAKRYCAEPGTNQVDALLAEAANLCLISRLTVVEIHSVFAIKVRRGEISDSGFSLLRKRFLADGKQRIFRVAAMTAAIYPAAVQLLRTHALGESLRTLDALQLAVALDLKQRGRLDYFVTADKSLASVATKAGLAVLNPEAI